MPRTTKKSTGPDTQADAIEELFVRGVTDGLPAIPPTRGRVTRALAATGREAEELVAYVPPNYGRATAEKIAVNAVMAGCRPEYLPVVIAGVEAMCDEAFDLHGVSATTHFASPLFIINGPIRKALDVNSGAGVFGPGWRANATIGRALRLIVVNIGGARPGVISMSTMGHPGRYTYCIGENEEANPWEPLHVEHGFAHSDSTVAAFAGEAPHGIYDHRSRTARDLLATVARSVEVIWHHKATALGDTLIVLSPEHAHTVAGDGWSKADIQRFLWERLQKPVKDLIPGKDGGEGLPEHVLAKLENPETDGTIIPKFRAPEHLKVVVAGGTAGRFSAVIPGWTFPNGSNLVIKKIRMRH
ncbi:MAG: hypothetical protein ACE5JN_06635 [Candidatus Methylomirabilia bacterium]